MASKSGKIHHVNPNDIFGENNESIPLEDLNIFVELTAVRADKTSIINSVDEVSTTTSNGGAIRFIDGSDTTGDGNHDNLTTNYTELSTTFNKSGENTEGLGLTNIDIEFNSSMMPQVTIGMVDIRGSSVFASGNNSQYNLFFDMPYPIFKLKIKGYYGQAVTYCLHMTKFTSRFNSQTGNFEITCNMIGHTYAFLSDMLIGYLRGNLFTTVGKQVQKEYAKRFHEKAGFEFLSFTEYFELADEAKKGAEKIKKNSDEAKKADRLEKIADAIKVLPITIQQFFKKQVSTVYKIEYGAIFFVSKDSTKENTKTYLDTCNKSIKEYIASNYKNGTPLDIEFESNDEFTFAEATIDELKTTTTPINTYELINEIGNHKELATYPGTTKITYVIFQEFNKKIENRKNELKGELRASEDSVNALLENNTMSYSKFPSSLRNVIALITGHVDILVETIRRVSKKAKDNPNRKLTTGGIEELRNSVGLIHPWPLYQIYDSNEETSDGGVYEAWIGNALDTVDNKSEFPEYEYIKQLIEGISTVNSRDKERTEEGVKYEKLWYSVNPLEIFAKKNPYHIKQVNNTRVVRILLDRYYTFTNSNKINRLEDFNLLAKLEANNIYEGLMSAQNELLADNFGTLLIEEGIISEFSRPNEALENTDKNYIIPNGEYSNYQYGMQGFDGAGVKNFLPLSDNLSTPDIIKKVQFGSPTNSIYLNNKILPISATYSSGTTPYSSGTTEDVAINDKGETYLKIVDVNTLNGIIESRTLTPYDGTREELEELGTKKLDIYQLKAGGSMRDSGINQFNPKLGTVLFDQGELNSKVTSVASLFYKGQDVDFDDKLQVIQDVGYCFNNKLSPNGKVNKTHRMSYDVIKANGDYTEKKPIPLVTSNIEFLFYPKSHQPKTLKRIMNLGVQTPKPLVALEEGDFVNLTSGNKLPTEDKRHLGFYQSDFRFYFHAPEKEGESQMEFINLFSSKLYYGQTSNEAKAFLFLHTLPIFHHDSNIVNKSDASGGLFGSNNIKGLFNRTAGIINAPKPWILMVGALLWRIKEYPSGDPITFQEGATYLIPFNDIQTAGRYSYLTYVEEYEPTRYLTSNLSFKHGGQPPYVERTLMSLPYQVKEEFIGVFKSWVSNEYEWEKLRKGLEVFPDATNAATLDGYRAQWNNWFNNQSAPTPHVILSTPGYNTKHYQKIWPYSETNDFYSELRLDTPIQSVIKDFMSDASMYIVNGSWKIWNSFIEGGKNYFNGEPLITTKTDDLKTYIKNVKVEYDKLTTKDMGTKKEKDEKSTEKYGTLKSDILHLMTYREIQAIYEKWILGNEGIPWAYNDCVGLGSKEDLIDTFKFIDRGYNDIGDKFPLAPSIIKRTITGDINQSVYDVITRILSDNNIDFLPLPTFINFQDNKTLESMFTPYAYGESMGSVGPSFVCIYSGQKSKSLDLGPNSKKPSDGVDLNPNEDIPSDFNGVPVFDVNFGDEKQSIFTNISLDQEEFSETDEGLWIQEEISKRGEGSRVEQPQSLYNVYNTRSYSAQVEMLGNAMIQPFMYFQLNNIPMFHGGYLITRVNHSITPNTMKTNFTGVRIRRQKTPLIKKSESYAVAGQKTPYLVFDETLKGDSFFKKGEGIQTENQVFLYSRKGYTDQMVLNCGFIDPLKGMIVTSTLKQRGTYTNNAGDKDEIWHQGYDLGDLGDKEAGIEPNEGNTPVYVVQKGTVVKIKMSTSYDGLSAGSGGLYVGVKHEIEDKKGGEKKIMHTMYYHLATINPEIIDISTSEIDLTNGYNPNKVIPQGFKIGTMGGKKGRHMYISPTTEVSYDTAGPNSTNYHLHFEIREGKCMHGKKCQFRNPGDFLPSLINNPTYDPTQTINEG